MSDIEKFEKNNKIYVNVFGYDEGKNVYPRHVAKNEGAIDLLLISDGEKSHYCLIKNFNKLMARPSGQSHNSMHYCRRCLNGFTTFNALSNHKIYCNEQDAVRVELPEPGSKLKFENHNRSMSVPFVIYADFESFIKPIDTCEPNPEKSHTMQYQKHTPSSFCYYIKCFDDEVYCKKPVTYTAKYEEEDIGQVFVNMLEEEVKNIYHVVKERVNKFKRNMIFTENDKKTFESATVCHICGYNLRKKRGDVFIDDRVRDHCHLTGRYIGAAHAGCNINRQVPSFIPVIFHNFSGYDCYLFNKKLRTDPGEEINCIPKTEENYISFSKKIIVDKFTKNEDGKEEEIIVKREIRFLDSYKFMAASLDSLVNNITACGKCINCKLEKKPCQTPTDANLKITKSFYKDDNEGERLDPKLHKQTPLNGRVDDLHITLREKIDRKKLEYILNHPDDFDLGSRMIKGRKIDKQDKLHY